MHHPDAGVSGPDATTAGPDAASDGAVVGPSGDGAVTVSLAPHCVPSSTCGTEFVPPGYGWATGTFSIETVSVVCKSRPDLVQQWINGGWVSLVPFVVDAANEPDLNPDQFDIEDPSGHQTRDPQTGASVGSVQLIRACALTSAGVPECDPESFITVTNCSTCGATNCGPGRFLDGNCQCVHDFCPCPRDLWPACPTPAWTCWTGG
jgi:hypothetical protein